MDERGSAGGWRRDERAGAVPCVAVRRGHERGDRHGDERELPAAGSEDQRSAAYEREPADQCGEVAGGAAGSSCGDGRSGDVPPDGDELRRYGAADGAPGGHVQHDPDAVPQLDGRCGHGSRQHDHVDERGSAGGWRRDERAGAVPCVAVRRGHERGDRHGDERELPAAGSEDQRSAAYEREPADRRGEVAGGAAGSPGGDGRSGDVPPDGDELG